MLAFRRQHHQEIATDLTDRDATERRITELYTKAVEQLGNDKAPGPSLPRVPQGGPGMPRMSEVGRKPGTIGATTKVQIDEVQALAVP